MARKDRARGLSERLEAALAAGDHGAARAEARRALGDTSAEEADRAAAARLLLSLAPERAAALCGALGVAAALAVAGWVLTRS